MKTMKDAQVNVPLLLERIMGKPPVKKEEKPYDFFSPFVCESEKMVAWSPIDMPHHVNVIPKALLNLKHFS